MTDAFLHNNGQIDLMARALCPELTAFVAIGRLENLTTAAASLGILQPTLSRSLARLQHQLGVPLVARKGRGIALTRQGRAFLECAERSLSVLEAGLAEIVSDDDELSGSVRFSFQRSFRARAVPSLLKEYRATHPGIRISLAQGSTQSITADIANDQIDVGLVAPPPDDPRIGFAEIWTEPIQLVVPLDHRLATFSSVELSEVADENFILLYPGYGTRTLADRLLRRAGVTPRIAFETEDVTLARGLVEAGFGVSLLPLPSHETHEGVVAMSVCDPEASRQIAVIWSADRDLASPAANFRDHLVEHGRESFETMR